MAPITRFTSTRVTTRAKITSTENSFSGKNVFYSKRKAENSPPKSKNTKRPALNDLTNDGKTAKVKSILKSDKSVTVFKGKCAENAEREAVKVKVSRTVTGVRLPVIRKTVPTKPVNTTISKKQVEAVKKPAPKPPVRVTRSSLVLKPNTNSIQTKLTENPVVEVKITATAVRPVSDESTEKEFRVTRSSTRFSLTRKSLTTDKSLDSNSLYVSALEDISNSNSTKKEKKSEWYELTEFDKELIHDPYQVSIYAAEIFHYLKTREDYFSISDYMPKFAPDIKEDMRTILVDWMVEVQENFELNHETLYLGVKIVDAYLNKIDNIEKKKLQLLAAGAMFVACKYDERLSPLLEDFVYICAGTYTEEDIIAMEQRLLSTLNFELSFPISYSFLRRYARCARVPMPLLTLARFILELSLLDYRTVTLSDSKQAAAALYLAFRMVNHEKWTESLVFYTGYKLDDFKDIVFLFNGILRKKFPEEVQSIRTKYSHKIFFEVAHTRLISDEKLKKDMAEHS